MDYFDKEYIKEKFQRINEYMGDFLKNEKKEKITLDGININSRIKGDYVYIQVVKDRIVLYEKKLIGFYKSTNGLNEKKFVLSDSKKEWKKKEFDKFIENVKDKTPSEILLVKKLKYEDKIRFINNRFEFITEYNDSISRFFVHIDDTNKKSLLKDLIILGKRIEEYSLNRPEENILFNFDKMLINKSTEI